MTEVEAQQTKKELPGYQDIELKGEIQKLIAELQSSI